MNRSDMQRSRGVSRGRCAPPTPLTPTALACTALLWSLAAAAQAQDAPKPPAAAASAPAAQTVIVTGIRNAIETSVAAKRSSDSIVEVISMEDIGKLPDVSIADALARLPGVTAQRVNGRAEVIQIRGLSPNYAGTLLNGREMVSTSDSRQAEFDQFPAELLSGATVYKTPDATVIGQGLSGTVDLHTLHPLDFRGRQIVLNARAETNGNGQATPGVGPNGSRLSASYINQFADNTVGLALGYARLDSPGEEKEYKSWWWANTGVWGRPVVGAPEGAITLNGFEATATASKQTRDGLMAVLEFKPSDQFHSMLDLYYSKFEQKRAYTGLMSNLGPTWNDATEPQYSNVQTSVVNGDTIVTHATIDNLQPILLSQYSTRSDHILAAGWNNQYKLGDWTASADLSTSRAKRQEQFIELSAGAGVPTAIDINVATGNAVSQVTTHLNYADPQIVKLSDPGSWGRDGRGNDPLAKDDISALRLQAKRNLTGFFADVSFGVHHSKRDKDVHMDEWYYNLKNERTPVTVPTDLVTGKTSLAWAGIPGLESFNVAGAAASLYDVTPVSQSQTFARDYGIHESLTTGFLMGTIDSSVGSLPLRGNLGVQLVHTAQSSNGFVWDGTQSVPITGGTSFNDWLPSLNLALEATPDTYLRLGLGRTVARPRMEDMRAGFTGASVDTTTHLWSGSGGNPDLQPWRADGADISVEKYLSKGTYLSAAWYYKHLRNFIYTDSIQYDFTGFPNNSDIVPISNIGTLSAPANGKGGMISGIELAAALDARLLDPKAPGLGLLASVSTTRSSLHEGNNGNNPLDGMSGRVQSLTVYYEDKGFSLRLSERYRSPFTSTVRGIFYSSVTSKIDSERIFDAQVGYEWQDGMFKGLSVLAQANNLTNTPYRTRVGVASGNAVPGATLPEQYVTYGSQFLFGINYKL